MSDMDIGLSGHRFDQNSGRQNGQSVRHRFYNNKSKFIIRSSFINTLSNFHESFVDLLHNWSNNTLYSWYILPISNCFQLIFLSDSKNGILSYSMIDSLCEDNNKIYKSQKNYVYESLITMFKIRRSFDTYV